MNACRIYPYNEQPCELPATRRLHTAWADGFEATVHACPRHAALAAVYAADSPHVLTVHVSPATPPLRPTRRARRLLLALAALAALTAGATAHHWNPWARELDRQVRNDQVVLYEDGSRSDGSCTPGAPCDDSGEQP